MRKWNKFLLIGILMLINSGVYAASYRMNLNTNTRQVDANASVDVKINLNSIQGLEQGISACSLSLSSTGGVSINSVSGQSGWNVTRGGKVVLDSSQGTMGSLDIANINVTVASNGTISISGITCTDGVEYEDGTNGDSISFTIRVPDPTSPPTPATNNNDTNKKKEEEKKQEEKQEEKKEPKELKITRFEVVGYNLGFDKDEEEYVLTLAKNVNKLYIIVEGEEITVSGDKEVSLDNKKEVVVEVSNSDVKKAYTIYIEREKEVKETIVEKKETNNMPYYLLIPLIAFVIISIVELIIILKKHKKSLVIVGE